MIGYLVDDGDSGGLIWPAWMVAQARLRRDARRSQARIAVFVAHAREQPFPHQTSWPS
jgi:hypothetical protein